MWNKDIKWFFEPGTPDGFNDGGIAEFKSTKYDGLAREIIQNSIDAKAENVDKPVKVTFEKMILYISDFPNPDSLIESVEKCIDFISDDVNNRSSKDLDTIKKMVERIKEQGKFLVLKISDSNTTGLPGFDSKVKTPWANLVRISGNNSKRAGSGGSFGIGKYAPFVFSNIRTLIYSTKVEDGDIAVQGKTILSGHKGDGNYRTPNGYFGNFGSYTVDGQSHDDSIPFYNADEIPDAFIRKEVGTSIFVLCASLPIEWVRQVESSVINSFFYSIYNNMLEVEIISDNQNIIIDKDTIVETTKKLIDVLPTKELKISNEYLKLLVNIDDCIYQDTHIFELPNREIGMMKLYLFSNKDIEGKNIAHIRNTGMKIEEKNPRSLVNYAGINITANFEMNKFLTECEAPKHDIWSSNNYGTEESQEMAKKILNELIQWEREAVKSLATTNSNDHIDPLGMNDYLSSELDGENDVQNNNRNIINFEPIKTELQSRKESSKTYTDVTIFEGILESLDGELDIETSYGNNNCGGGTGPGNGGSSEGGTSSDGNKQKIEKVPIKYIKTPYISNGKYVVSFIPLETMNNCFVKFRSAGDDVFENLKVKSIIQLKNSTLEEANLINTIVNQKVVLQVEFENFDRGVLEVGCYVKK